MGKRITMLDAVTTLQTSTKKIQVDNYRILILEVHGSAGAKGSVKVKISDQDTVNFSEPDSATNSWSYAGVSDDKARGATIDGGVGVAYITGGRTGGTAHVEVNINACKYMTVELDDNGSDVLSGTFSAWLTLSDNE